MKKVEYDGKSYKIAFDAYGYTSSRLTVNGDDTGVVIDNSYLNSVDEFRKYAKKAIIDYEDRINAESIFKAWDGKL